MARLMKDFNIASVKVPQQFFSFDLITSNNKRLEVKTALLRKFERKHANYPTYYSDAWEFRRNPKQHREGSSDFVVCMGFQSNDYSDEPRCFIIPTNELRGLSEVIKISAKSKRKGKPKYWEYEDKWDLVAEEKWEERCKGCERKYRIGDKGRRDKWLCFGITTSEGRKMFNMPNYDNLRLCIKHPPRPIREKGLFQLNMSKQEATVLSECFQKLAKEM